MVEGCKSARKGCGRVSLHDNAIGSMQSEYPGETRQCRPCQIGQILIWPHDLEIPVWVQVEQVEDLRQQLAVLAGYADFAIEIRSS
jgi:hypothetical protein